MKTIYLISCCKEKLPSAAKAKDLYQSEGFKRRLAFAKYQKADEILILSAKHHIVELDQILEPYDVCLSNETVGEQKKWAEICIASLKSKFDLTKEIKKVNRKIEKKCYGTVYVAVPCKPYVNKIVQFLRAADIRHYLP